MLNVQTRLSSLVLAMFLSNTSAQTPEHPQQTPTPVVSGQPAQDTSIRGVAKSVEAASPAERSIAGFLTDILRDEKSIVTSPARVKGKDLSWLVPLAGGAGFLVASDERNMRERIKTDAAIRSKSLSISNMGSGSLAIIPAVVYWWGWRHADDYAMDSSVLTARALADSLVLGEGMRLVTRRDVWGWIRAIFRRGRDFIISVFPLRCSLVYRICAGPTLSRLAVASRALRPRECRQPEPCDCERAFPF